MITSISKFKLPLFIKTIFILLLCDSYLCGHYTRDLQSQEFCKQHKCCQSTAHLKTSFLGVQINTGSAVLCKLENKIFILTAAHCVSWMTQFLKRNTKIQFQYKGQDVCIPITKFYLYKKNKKENYIIGDIAIGIIDYKYYKKIPSDYIAKFDQKSFCIWQYKIKSDFLENIDDFLLNNINSLNEIDIMHILFKAFTTYNKIMYLKSNINYKTKNEKLKQSLLQLLSKINKPINIRECIFCGYGVSGDPFSNQWGKIDGIKRGGFAYVSPKLHSYGDMIQSIIGFDSYFNGTDFKYKPRMLKKHEIPLTYGMSGGGLYLNGNLIGLNSRTYGFFKSKFILWTSMYLSRSLVALGFYAPYVNKGNYPSKNQSLFGGGFVYIPHYAAWIAKTLKQYELS